MAATIEELEKYYHHHRIATYAIVAFLSILTLSVVFLFRQTQYQSLGEYQPKEISPQVAGLQIEKTPPAGTSSDWADTVWVAFGPMGKPGTNWDTADKLLNLLTANGNNVFAVNRWQKENGKWETHLINLPDNNFDIKEGEGYLVSVKGIPRQIETGNLQFAKTGLLKYQIPSGWSFISIPDDLLPSIAGRDAKGLCTSINEQGGSVSEVDERALSDVTSFWLSHKCGGSADNFGLVNGQAYFIKSASPSSWLLPAGQ
ncbi:hypothetical protein M1271_06625 [Patescibacteria group bacterium]|nr:hypothetical protein [Patescibacteria group bacterium]MCL5798398.1 hypothetical protein [Patescibacteria group bacterium]